MLFGMPKLFVFSIGLFGKSKKSRPLSEAEGWAQSSLAVLVPCAPAVALSAPTRFPSPEPGGRNKLSPGPFDRLHVNRTRLRQDAEASAAVDAVGLEVGSINRKNRGQRLTFCKVDQSGIREVHWPVMVAVH